MKFVPVPTFRLITLLAVNFLLFLGGTLMPLLTGIGLGVNLILAAAGIWEMTVLLKQVRLTLEFQKPCFTMGLESQVTLVLNNSGSRSCSALVSLELPPFWSRIDNPVKGIIPAKGTYSLPLLLKPFRRGKYVFSLVHTALHGPLGLFVLNRSLPIKEEVTVYPDLKELKEYLTLSRENRLYEMGIHRNRYRGMGTELESLLDYSPGDDTRFIDWKATARRGKPIIRTYQMENRSQIVFALDCGRHMMREEDNLSSLDLAVNALLVLSHMAVKMGDRIRIVAFDDRIRGDFLSPKSGKSLEKIRDFLAPLQPEFVESDYGHLFTHLHKTLNKRSLVILLSDLTDSVNYKLLRHHFTLLSRKHSLVFLLLRDKLMNKESEYTAKNQEEIYRVTAARSLLLERHDTLKRLERTGIHILDLMPQEVTARLVDKYLQLKGENRI